MFVFVREVGGRQTQKLFPPALLITKNKQHLARRVFKVIIHPRPFSVWGSTYIVSSHFNFNLFTRVAYVFAYPLKISLFTYLQCWLFFSFVLEN